ncbi:MAG: glycosyltransferase family 39 protein [Bryobacteraceae bacterium]|nr:glycosyltransferase family 39 protein [Bryobacteraceae bacterium]
MSNRTYLLLLGIALAASRLAHAPHLWADDTLPLASAQQVWRGATLYRDVWFDKPPLVSWIYLMWGAQGGWPLRLAGALFAWVAAWLAFLAARSRWGDAEGRWAAFLMAFFLIFGLPSAVLPLASDSLLLAPHLAAILFAWRGHALLSGAAAGAGLLASSKALLILPVCVLWQIRSPLPVIAGFAIPNLAAILWMSTQGSLADFWRQAWEWGRIYAANTFVEHPLREGVSRTVNWLGFHSAAAIAAFIGLAREKPRDRTRWILWLILAMLGVAAGLRFFPRYYFLLLPPLALAGSRGCVILTRGRAGLALILLLLAIPALRFGPRYFTLAADALAGRETQWRDLALDRDSREVAAMLGQGSLFVWGFRSEIYLYSGLRPASRFLESQAVSGVLADRHLFRSDAVAPEFVAPQRQELLRSRPDWIVDAAGPLNPAMEVRKWLPEWMSAYREVARSKYSAVYRLR